MGAFEFKSVSPTVAMDIPAEPPDKSGDSTMKEPFKGEGGSNVSAGISFRDKVLGLQTVPRREKVDLVEKKLVHIKMVNGNRLSPMLRVDKGVLAESSLPWKDDGKMR